jgi:hypothetical protein
VIAALASRAVDVVVVFVVVVAIECLRSDNDYDNDNDNDNDNERGHRDGKLDGTDREDGANRPPSGVVGRGQA